ncbi:hypothetical protein M427DRAFT_59844 [Gonapodya prolifera JEL478]|uniref:Uncharacterized protein n=1 Tax=Gonapodya prolifera (strain JEL478) TaxID=1344416 RepID=A0A139A578_GONPJ|nr:hypothetical protein M427DRAFT_59844 [Gonapodya prolifera JEL478]|eukprot:KXS11972.1 hypothetical protein M427DRAFT_59844 [Gonapodya prolifera JEL478]
MISFASNEMASESKALGLQEASTLECLQSPPTPRSKSPSLPDLPSEILLRIFSFILPIPSLPSSRYTPRPRGSWSRSVMEGAETLQGIQSMYSVILTSKSWCASGVEVLWRFPRLGPTVKPHSVKAFSDALYWSSDLPSHLSSAPKYVPRFRYASFVSHIDDMWLSVACETDGDEHPSEHVSGNMNMSLTTARQPTVAPFPPYSLHDTLRLAMIACPNLHKISIQLFSPLFPCLPWSAVSEKLHALEYGALLHKRNEGRVLNIMLPQAAPNLRELVVSRVEEVTEWMDETMPTNILGAASILVSRAPNLSLLEYTGRDTERVSGTRRMQIAAMVPRGVTNTSLLALSHLPKITHLHFAPGHLSNYSFEELSTLLGKVGSQLTSLTVTLRSNTGCSLDALISLAGSLPMLSYLRISPGNRLDYLGDRCVDTSLLSELPAQNTALETIAVANGVDFIQRRGVAMEVLGQGGWGGAVDAVRREWTERWGGVCDLILED